MWTFRKNCEKSKFFGKKAFIRKIGIWENNSAKIITWPFSSSQSISGTHLCIHGIHPITAVKEFFDFRILCFLAIPQKAFFSSTIEPSIRFVFEAENLGIDRFDRFRFSAKFNSLVTFIHNKWWHIFYSTRIMKASGWYQLMLKNISGNQFCRILALYLI